MEGLELRATPRTVIKKQVKALRRQGIIPGVIYGHGIESIAVQFDSREVEKSISNAGTSTTVQVYVEGIQDPYLTIFRDVQYDPIKHNVIHLDLQALNIKETVRVPVTVVLIGECPAVEESEGVLIHLLNELEIEALPTALVPSIEVDVSQITEIGQSISVGDLVPPEGITILNSPADVIVQVIWMEEEAEEELEGVPEVGEVEVIGEVTADEEEMEV